MPARMIDVETIRDDSCRPRPSCACAWLVGVPQPERWGRSRAKTEVQAGALRAVVVFGSLSDLGLAKRSGEVLALGLRGGDNRLGFQLSVFRWRVETELGIGSFGAVLCEM